MTESDRKRNGLNRGREGQKEMGRQKVRENKRWEGDQVRRGSGGEDSKKERGHG